MRHLVFFAAGVLLLLSVPVFFFSHLFADTQISVSGIITPQPSDYSIAITSDQTAPLSQGKTITYTITYGGSAGTGVSATTTVVADFSADSPDGGNTHTTMYVDGSATPAVYNTQPVIDLVNQKITWTILNFNSGITNKKVQFQLKTTTSYTGNSSVPVVVKAKLYNTYVSLPSVSATNSYLFDSSLVPTATTSQPSVSSTPSTQSKTTPTPASSIAVTNTKIISPTPSGPTWSAQNVTVVSLSQSSTQIALTLPPKTTSTVVYGTSPKALTTSSPIASSGTDGLIDLDTLAPQTTYYMQVVTTDSSGKTTKSDVFSVETAQVSDTPQVAKASVVIASDNDVLYSAGLNSQSGQQNTPTSLTQTPQIPLAPQTNYNMAFKLNKTNSIKSVTVVMKNISVLGISTFAPPPSPTSLEYSFAVNAGINGVYTAQIKNPPVAGLYDAYIRIADFDGNISTQKIAEFRALKPFRVYNAQTKEPIEDARVLIYRLDPTTKKYLLIPNLGGTSNPLYTNRRGEASEALSKGTYKANFGRIGYTGQDNVAFTLGVSTKDDFPTVYLQPTPITPLSIFIYYRNAFTDYVGTTASYIGSLQASYRYFDLVGLGVIGCFVILAFLLFSIRSHIALFHMPAYLSHHFFTALKKQSGYLSGKVTDAQTHAPIANVAAYLLDTDTQQILATAKTNTSGAFLLPEGLEKYMISFLKEGYEARTLPYEKDMSIFLAKAADTRHRGMHFFVKTLEDGFSLFFEFFLVLSVLLEIVLFPAFGLWKTIPFLLASVCNIALWIFYLRETRQ